MRALDICFLALRESASVFLASWCSPLLLFVSVSMKRLSLTLFAADRRATTRTMETLSHAAFRQELT